MLLVVVSHVILQLLSVEGLELAGNCRKSAFKNRVWRLELIRKALPHVFDLSLGEVVGENVFKRQNRVIQWTFRVVLPKIN